MVETVIIQLNVLKNCHDLSQKSMISYETIRSLIHICFFHLKKIRTERVSKTQRYGFSDKNPASLKTSCCELLSHTGATIEYSDRIRENNMH